MSEIDKNQSTDAQSTSVMPRLRPDFNSSQKLSHIPLNGRNYLTWAKTAKVTLKGKGLLGFINGTRKRPTEGLDAQEDWDMFDGQTMSLISNILEPQLIDLFVHCETAFELWKEIEGQYSNQKNHSHIFQLKQEIAKITHEGRAIPELIGVVRAKYEKLKTYRPTTTDLAVLQEKEEHDRVYTLLATLDLSYEAIRAQILLTTGKLSFTEVTSLIQQEESR